MDENNTNCNKWPEHWKIGDFILCVYRSNSGPYKNKIYEIISLDLPWVGIKVDCSSYPSEIKSGLKPNFNYRTFKWYLPREAKLSQYLFNVEK